jgi:hypothetical protein
MKEGKLATLFMGFSFFIYQSRQANSEMGGKLQSSAYMNTIVRG